ncbi:hypothetical protein F4827_000401 [Paraburkholderia bannensis]|uniref:Uncharacterized protein n=1 Tax=Paraburkholderia bannensis TaxID=765414 RepID=A0A7W9TSJ9_9BURK|nr:MULTISPECIES: hypothetical protein [Paraburkholderia]MBB3255391.1 hypothetical protein [Paraburkholderia sp. WP4_3_2]MBB6100597.1 hypothetical protein [Paraburkholderia bannensis]
MKKPVATSHNITVNDRGEGDGEGVLLEATLEVVLGSDMGRAAWRGGQPTL